MNRALAILLAAAATMLPGCGAEEGADEGATMDAASGSSRQDRAADVELTDSERDRARLALDSYGCTSCHLVPGVVGKEAFVGPPLDEAASRVYVAGVLLNTPDNMQRWIMEPQEVDPLTAMPDLGVGERDARLITQYLYEHAGRP